MGWPQRAAKHPHNHLLSSLGEGQRENRMKARQLMDWNKDSLTGEAKAMCTNTAKWEINLLLPISRHMASHFLASRTSAHLTVAWGGKCHNHKSPSYVFLSWSFYCWAQCHMVLNIPSISSGQPSWTCLLAIFCPFSSYRGRRRQGRVSQKKKKKASVLSNHYSAIHKIDKTLFQSQIQSKAPFRLLLSKLTSS